MNVEFSTQEKDIVEFKVDNPTIAEIIRVYLNQQGVEFAAWKREHPSKPVIMRIQVSNGTVKKAISDAVKAIEKDLSKFTDAIKK